MKCRYLSFLIFLAVINGVSLPLCHADLLVSNLAEPTQLATPIGNPQFWGAQSFSTSTSGVELTSVAAIVGNGANSPIAVAELRRSTGVNNEIDTTAGGLLGTFTAPDLTGALSPRIFNPLSGISLDPNTTYWFLLGSSNAGTFEWSFAGNNNFTGVGTLGNYSDSVDAGASWILRGNEFPYHIEVITSVPEPACAGAACVMIGCLFKRRRRAV